jgi:hypothetical protein
MKSLVGYRLERADKSLIERGLKDEGEGCIHEEK